tara:strand:- start:2369 stop:2815 length:447 start_codon:yes stop_codon:yes gene_type:complete
MGFFNFVKNIGRKILGAGKVVLGKGKDLLKTGVSIGNKVLNNPISKKVIDIATPFLGATPVGRAVLLGVKGAQKGLEIGEKLLSGIDAGERVAKNIQKIRDNKGSLISNVGNIVKDVKTGFEAGKSGVNKGEEVVKIGKKIKNEFNFG